MNEEWIGIRGIEGYEISNYGRVRNRKTRRILKTHLNRPDGYERVNIGGKHRYIHKMMADSFSHEGLKPGDIVQYRDGNKRKNLLHNLRIVKKEDRIPWEELDK